MSSTWTRPFTKSPSLRTSVRGRPTSRGGCGHSVVNVEVSVCVTPLAVSPADIRDTVNYKEVMKQYGLGPNGGIVTSLNLFATRFDQVTCSDSAFCVKSDLIGSSINQLKFLCGSVPSHW